MQGDNSRRDHLSGRSVRGALMVAALDLHGRTFGRLTVDRRAANDARGRTRWLCCCQCGRDTTVAGYKLTTGHTTSCGCLAGTKARMDLTGVRFGRLVVEAMDVSRAGRTLAQCRCDCGSVTTRDAAKLNSGESRSCGCAPPPNKTHGRSRTPLYRVWLAMHQRCGNPRDSSFRNYGARGIAVCERWATFENFFADMGERPPNTSIDRRDNDKGYSPDNCRWATRTVQNTNRRNPGSPGNKRDAATGRFTKTGETIWQPPN